jgi:hypothetical protein
MRDVPKRLYLAGPMSDVPKYNFPLFNRVASRLRGQGYSVFNPAENKDGGLRRPRSYYMRLDIPALLESDAVAVLPGWEKSRGASLEVWLALDLDMPVFNVRSAGNKFQLEPFRPPGPARLPFQDPPET